MRKLKHAELPIVRAQILRNQGGVCPLCKRKLSIQGACQDHDHSTGLLRGVLCRNCNGIEGKIKNLAVRGRATLSLEQYVANVVRYWVHHNEDRTGFLYPTHLNEDEKRLKRNAKARKARAAKKASK
ncbi:endonuclease VII [Agrobacterium phage Alfirin]|nr:endonuclease VII [Agrobacterium phage Alfirin]